MHAIITALVYIRSTMPHHFRFVNIPELDFNNLRVHLIFP